MSSSTTKNDPNEENLVETNSASVVDITSVAADDNGKEAIVAPGAERVTGKDKKRGVDSLVDSESQRFNKRPQAQMNVPASIGKQALDETRASRLRIKQRHDAKEHVLARGTCHVKYVDGEVDLRPGDSCIKGRCRGELMECGEFERIQATLPREMEKGEYYVVAPMVQKSGKLSFGFRLDQDVGNDALVFAEHTGTNEFCTRNFKRAIESVKKGKPARLVMVNDVDVAPMSIRETAALIRSAKEAAEKKQPQEHDAETTEEGSSSRSFTILGSVGIVLQSSIHHFVVYSFALLVLSTDGVAELLSSRRCSGGASPLSWHDPTHPSKIGQKDRLRSVDTS